jgi:signal transduction histidine kinase
MAPAPRDTPTPGAGDPALEIPVEPWNSLPTLHDATALQAGLRLVDKGGAGELPYALRLASALKSVRGWQGATHALRARRLARRSGDESGRAMASALSAHCYLSNGRGRLALVVARAAVERCGPGVDLATAIYLETRLARALVDRGEPGKAVDICLNLLSRTYLARLAGLRGVVLTHLGFIADSTGLYEQAWRLYSAAQRLSALVPIGRQEPRSYNNNLAMSLVRQARKARLNERHDDAQRFASRAVELARDAVEYSSTGPHAANHQQMVIYVDTLIQALHASGFADEAMGVYNSIEGRVSSLRGDASAHLNGQSVCAQILLDRGDAPAAVEVAAAAFARLRQGGVNEGLMDLALVLASAHEQLGQWREACRHHQWIQEATERQDRERLALGLTELADKLDLRRGDLMFYLAHELRSPLTSVLALLAAHKIDQDLTPAQRNDVRERVAQALDTAERVLDYARLQSLRHVDQQPIDLFALLDDACEEVGLRARARRVHIALEPGAGATTTGERALLLRTLVALLDNALRHSPSGSTVRVQLDASPYCIRLSIEDEGPGFDLDEMATFFARKASPDQQRRINLGLPLAARVIALHDGALLLDNRPQGGARVLVALPLAE